MPQLLNHSGKVMQHGIVLVLPPLATALLLLFYEVENPWWRWGLSLGLVLAATSSLLTLVHLSRQTYLRIANGLSTARLGPDAASEAAVPANRELEHVLDEIDGICQSFERQRAAQEDARSLVTTLISSHNEPILVVDERLRVIDLNDAAALFFGESAASLCGRTALELGIAGLLDKDASHYGIHLGAREVKRISFLDGASRKTLLRVTGNEAAALDRAPSPASLPASFASNAHETSSWQVLVGALIAVTSEQLTAIRSLAATVRGQVEEPLPPDWRSRFSKSLEKIGRHVEQLSKFSDGYAALVRVPAPVAREIELRSWLNEIIDRDEQGITVEGGPAITLHGDPILLEQALRNAIAFGVAASAKTDGETHLSWQATPDEVCIHIDDEGPTLAPGSDVFVPSSRTADERASHALGMALARLIVEAHGGRLEVASSASQSGCRTSLRLPRDGVAFEGDNERAVLIPAASRRGDGSTASVDARAKSDSLRRQRS